MGEGGASLFDEPGLDMGPGPEIFRVGDFLLRAGRPGGSPEGRPGGGPEDRPGGGHAGKKTDGYYGCYFVGVFYLHGLIFCLR